MRVKNDDKVPFILVANKFDLDLSQHRVSMAKVQELASLWNVPLYETSAKTNTNVKEVNKIIIIIVNNLTIQK